MKKNIVTVNDNSIIQLGYVGDNSCTVVRIPVVSFITKYGEGGIFELIHTPPGSEIEHPIVSIELVSGCVEWTVGPEELVKEGVGEVQLRYIDSNGATHTKIWKTIVHKSLIRPNAPKPWVPWVDVLYKYKHDAEVAAGHYPYIDSDTERWMVWSVSDEEYVDTGIYASGNGVVSMTVNPNGSFHIVYTDGTSVDIGEDVLAALMEYVTAANNASDAAEAARVAAESAQTNAYASEQSASASAANAAASESSVSSYASAAAVSSIAAEESATSAANSATNAGASEYNASQYAANAMASATNASNSEDIAVNAANAASQSETNAHNSEVSAGSSATNAAASATSASESESNASAYAANAAASATAASTSESNAGTFANSAAASEANAATSESNAFSHASAAAASATAASESASEALASEQSAAQSAASATEAASKSEASASHNPIIGDDGKWWIWDADEERYINSGAIAKGTSFWFGTREEYNNLHVYDPDVLYCIEEGT